jgi:hypothetical protein
VIELDGPPMAYFDVCADAQSTVTFVYREVGGIKLKDEDSAIHWWAILRAKLNRHLPEYGFLFWRIRPEIARINEGIWGVYGRLITSPPVPESFWDEFESRRTSASIGTLAELNERSRQEALSGQARFEKMVAKYSESPVLPDGWIRDVTVRPGVA